jgi:hypothetical protein
LNLGIYQSDTVDELKLVVPHMPQNSVNALTPPS